MAAWGRAGVIAGLALVATGPVTAAETEPVDGRPADAMLTVTAPALPGRVLPPAVALGEEALLDRQPRSLGDALRGLPGVTVRLNSRGETIPRVRGAEERQTQVFLDGAPLVVPWDGRIDIGLIPAGLIGGVTVRKGAVPIEYGTNAIAGVVDLSSRRQGHAGVLQIGSYDLVNASAVAAIDWRGVGLTLGAAHQAQHAVRVADPAAVPFSQAPDRRRTNSDSAATSLYGAIGGQLGPVGLRASILHFQAARGVAPESDRDPAQFAPRYWRYPDIDFTQAQLTADVTTDSTRLALTVWRQWFGQTILAYRAVDYQALRSREDNDDDTRGGRLTFGHRLGPASLRWSASVSQADHRQRDTAFPPGTPGPDLRYRQTLASLGLEADVPLGPATRLTLGGGYDRSENPRTGDKPAQPDKDAPAFAVALAHDVDDRLSLSLSGGRRTRFPSARELFGEALGRFLANPELRPETAWLADVELRWRRGGTTLIINPFLIRAEDGIAQRIVSTGGRSLRQRFNDGPALSYGVDLLALLPVTPHWTAELTGSFLQAATDTGRPLLQRPAHELMLALDWAPVEAFDARLEVRRIGAGRDLAPDGTLARLQPATEVNLRARVPIVKVAGGRIALTAAFDNMTDAVVVPQLGLPSPGRTIRLGLMVTG